MKKLVAFCAIWLCFNASAQYVIHTVGDVWRLAMERNSECEVYKLKMAQAQQEIKLTQAQLYPSIGIKMNGQANIDLPETPVPGELFGKPNESIPLTFGKKFQYSGGVFLSKKLFDWQTHYQSKISVLGHELAVAQRQYFYQTLKEQIAVAYYLTLTSMLCQQTLESDGRIADTIFQITKERHAQGVIDDILMNQATIKKIQVAQQQLLMQQQSFQNMNQLKELTGLSLVDTLKFEEQLALDKPMPELIGIENTNYLKLKELQYSIAEFERKKNFGGFMPKLELYSFWGYRQYHDKASFSFHSHDFLPENYLGLSMSLPLFSGFANSAKCQYAHMAQQIAAIYLEDAQRTSLLRDSTLRKDLVITKTLAWQAYESLLISTKNVQLAKNKYAVGLIGLEDYLKVFDAHLDFENQFFEQLAKHLIHKASVQAREKQ